MPKRRLIIGHGQLTSLAKVIAPRQRLSNLSVLRERGGEKKGGKLRRPRRDGTGCFVDFIDVYIYILCSSRVAYTRMHAYTHTHSHARAILTIGRTRMAK